ncbi:hypothetical protein J6TS2_49090 [Heyndrickxia sporothermodurans]|nr:hypothetical protein J6TS2_49090 [Heyndrickxia sporothermodurans]
MPQQRLYHEFINGKIVPYLYVLTFKPCELNWDKPEYYFNVIKPFEHFGFDEFDDTLNNASIYLGDFIINKSYPDKIGINLNLVKKRILNYGVDPYVIRQFIAHVLNIEEFLNLIPNERKLSFCVGRS